MIDRSTHTSFKFRGLDDLRHAIRELGLAMDVEEDLSHLTRPITLCGRTVPNAMAIQPMEGCDGTADGSPGDLTFRRYHRFGAGGAGLIWFEACAVVHKGRANPRQLWLHETNKGNFARLLNECLDAARESMGSEHRPFTVLQLTHSGRYSKPGDAFAPIIAYHDPYLDPTRHVPPAQPPISNDELKALEDAFVQSARLAFEVGFDAVDVKACHRYLTNELLAAHTRKGEFGGGYENRTRFLKEVILRIRAELGEDKIVTSRMNVFDGHPYPYGWGMDPATTDAPDLDEPRRLIRELHGMGLDLLNITMGNPYLTPHINRPYDKAVDGGYYPKEHPLIGVERLVSLTRQSREGLPGLAVIGSGYSWLRRLWPYVAAAEISGGHIQMVGLGRQSFAYPGFAKEIIETGKLDRKHTCISCSCCSQIMRQGGATGCAAFDGEVYGPIYRGNG